MPSAGRKGGKMKAPCKNCDRRQPGCHSVCAEYKQYDAERAKIRAERALNRQCDTESSPVHDRNTWNKAKRQNR